MTISIIGATHYQPLDTVRISVDQPVQVQIRDGKGNIYHEAEVADSHDVVIGGSLGEHVVFALVDEKIYWRNIFLS